MGVLTPFHQVVDEKHGDVRRDLSGVVLRPWRVVRLLFAPRYASVTPVAEQLVLARSWVGFLLTAWLCWPYFTVERFLDNFFGDVLRTLAIAAVTAFAVLVAGFFLHARTDRPGYLRRAAWPLGRLIGLPLLAYGISELRYVESRGTPLALVRTLLAVWVAVVLVSVLWQIGCGMFGTADAHPALGPATTAITLTAALVYRLAFAAPTPVPASVSLLINLAGYATALSLCALELTQTLTAQHNHPHPATRSDPSPADRSEPRSAPGSAARPEPSSATRSDPGAEPSSEPRSATRSEPGSAARSEPGSAIRPETGSERRPELGCEAGPAARSDIEEAP